VKDALKEFKAEAIRLFLLSTHYGRPSNYTEEGMHSATRGMQRLQDAHDRLSEAASSDAATTPGDAELLEATEACKSAFGAAMDDNLNTPIAISVLFDWVKAINTSMKTGVSAAAAAPAQAVMEDLAGTVLGILPGESATSSEGGDLADPLMQVLIELRKNLRTNQQFELADGIRDSLQGLNVELKDSPDGTTWSQG
jgi:cysteinyl-tRNA synthetase